MNALPIRAAWFRRPARIVGTIGLVAGLGFALLVPPLAGYDESIHFLRAYQVSQGGVIATHRDHQLGGSMPSELRTDLGRLLTDGVYSRHDRTAFLDHLGDRPAGGRREFFDFPSGAVYSAVPYAPAALFIAIGRLLGVSTLVLLYLGRIGNLLAVVGLLTLAVRRMPTHAWMLAAVALLPVTVFQAAMISADGVTIALALLVLALALDLVATPRGEVTNRRLVEVAIATIALGFAKPPYILFALALLLPIRRHGAAVARSIGATLGAGLTAAAVWGVYASSVYIPQALPPGYAGPVTRFTVYTHVDQHRQRQYVLHHPWTFLHVIVRTVTHYGSDLLRETTAQLPYYTVPVAIVVAAFGLVAMATAIPETARSTVLGGYSRAFLIAIALTTFCALMLLAYLGWNAVGSPRVEAFQGRYLVPLIPLFLLALPTPARRRDRVARSAWLSQSDRHSCSRSQSSACAHTSTEESRPARMESTAQPTASTMLSANVTDAPSE